MLAGTIMEGGVPAIILIILAIGTSVLSIILGMVVVQRVNGRYPEGLRLFEAQRPSNEERYFVYMVLERRKYLMPFVAAALFGDFLLLFPLIILASGDYLTATEYLLFIGTGLLFIILIPASIDIYYIWRSKQVIVVTPGGVEQWQQVKGVFQLSKKADWSAIKKAWTFKPRTYGVQGEKDYNIVLWFGPGGWWSPSAKIVVARYWENAQLLINDLLDRASNVDLGDTGRFLRKSG